MSRLRCHAADRATEPIATSRLDLTPLTPDDADEMVGVLADEALYAFIGGAAPTLEALRSQYERQAVGHSADGTETWLNWIIRTRVEGRAMGFVQATITNEGHDAEIAWVVGVPWQGRGHATEAAAALVAWLDAQGVGVDHGQRPPGPRCVRGRRATHRPVAVPDRIVDGERVWASGAPATDGASD